MTKTVRSEKRFPSIAAALLAAFMIIGCAPDLRTQRINLICEGTDKAALQELITSGEHDKRVGRGDESVADSWWYPIHIAAFANNPVALQVMLEANVDPNIQDVDGATPLMRLFSGGREGDTQASIELLVKAGADVNIADRTQSTPLHMAANYDLHECLKALVEAGGHVNAKDRFGNTSLHLAASAIGGVAPKTFEVLIELGADRTATNDAGKTPLELCRENKCGCEDLLQDEQ
jgi:ankyrin repeat protein